MDKYRREDDPNDDLGAYNQNEDLPVVSDRPNKRTYSIGVSADDGEFNDRLIRAKDRLTNQENKVFDLLTKRFLSISEVAVELEISQQMVSKYWKRIREKLA